MIGVSIDFETLSNFSLQFSDKFSSSDVAFELFDMLKQSVSMGKKYSSDQYSTTAFTDSGASGTIDNYIKSAFDASKQEIFATVGQAFMLDENGFRMRKWLADRSGYEPEQIWMNNNAINFTSDNWDTVRTALGKVAVGDSTLYGLVAEVIIGTLIAGKNLHINTEKENGKPMTFKVDGAGVRLYNGNIYLSMDGGGKILLDPAHGILLGTSDLFAFDENDQVTVDNTKANMWLDMDGIIHLEGVKAQGDIQGSTIKGSEIYIGGNNTAENCKFGVDKAGNIVGLETLNGKLKFDSEGKAYFKNDVEISGDLTLSGNINMSGGKITWGDNIPNKKRYAASTSGPWHDTLQSGDIYCCDWNYTSGVWGAAYKFVGTDGAPGNDADVTYGNIKTALSRASKAAVTFITGTTVDTADIYANNIYGGNIYAGRGLDSYAKMTESGLEVYVDGIYTPKFKLGLGEGGTNDPYMILGAGDGAGNNQLWISKSDNYALIFYQYASGATSGFMFHDDGTITTMGKLKGVTAEFG